jgi:hypothetical protein
MNKSWQVDEASTDELCEQLVVVMDDIAPRVAARVLRQKAIADERQMSWVRRYGRPPISITPGQVRAWLAALTKPRETTR